MTRVHRHRVDKASQWGPFGRLDLINLDISITYDHTVGIHIIRNHVPLMLKVPPGLPTRSWAWLSVSFIIQVFPTSPITQNTILCSVMRSSLQSPNRPWSFPHPSVSQPGPFSVSLPVGNTFCLSKYPSDIILPVKSHHSEHLLILFARRCYMSVISQ